MTVGTLLSLVPGLLLIVLVVRALRPGRSSERPDSAWSPLDTGPSGASGGYDGSCGPDGGGACS